MNHNGHEKGGLRGRPKAARAAPSPRERSKAARTASSLRGARRLLLVALRAGASGNHGAESASRAVAPRLRAGAGAPEGCSSCSSSRQEP